METWKILLVTMYLLVTGKGKSSVEMSVDGGYSSVIVRLEDSVGMENCGEMMRSLMVVLSNSSSTLLTRLSGKAYFTSFVIVVPQAWDEELCDFTEDKESEVAATKAADIFIKEDDDEDPYVEHSQGCGYPGEGIYIPLSSLSSLNSTTLVDKWVEYRYGVTRSLLSSDPCKTVEEILRDHPDFTEVVTDNEPHRANMAKIHVVRKPQTRYVLAIDTTASMLEGDAWKWVNKAAQKLIRYDLPSTSSLAVMSYGNTSKVEYPMARVDDRMADTVPGKYQLGDHHHPCLLCLFQNIVHHLLLGDTAGTHIILITRGGHHSPSTQHLLSSYVQDYGIKISTILINPPTILPLYDKLAQQSGGQSFLVRSSPHPMDVYFSLVTSLQQIFLPGAARTKTIHQQDHLTSKNTTEGTFYIDKSFGKNTQFGIYVPDTENHLIKSVTFQDEDGTLYGPYRKMSASYDLINFKTPNIVGEQPFAISTSREWRYKVEWFPSKEEIVKSIVTVTSDEKPGEEQLMVSSWVREMEWCNTFHHKRVFTRVRRDHRHVVGARVRLMVEIENENGTIFSLPPLDMLDNGDRETDEEHGDGIYSATILEYPTTGRYSLTVHVDEGEEDTGDGDYVGPVLHLSSLPHQDCVPPGRVTDLDISVSGSNRSVLATWTSPGGDLHIGQVNSFSLIYAQHVQDLLDGNKEAAVLGVVDRKSVAGDKVVQEVEVVTLVDQVLYFCVFAEDDAGNIGRISNIVEVFIPNPVTMAPVPELRLGQEPSTEQNLSIIIIISSSLGGVLMMSLLCVVFVIVTTRKPKTVNDMNSSIKSDFTSYRDSSSFPSYTDFSSSLPSTPPVMQRVTDLEQILAVQRTVYPVYCSAAQILRRDGSEDSYHPSYNTHSTEEESDDTSTELEGIQNKALYTIV